MCTSGQTWSKPVSRCALVAGPPSPEVRILLLLSVQRAAPVQFVSVTRAHQHLLRRRRKFQQLHKLLCSTPSSGNSKTRLLQICTHTHTMVDIDNVLVSLGMGRYQFVGCILFGLMIMYSNVSPVTYVFTASDLKYR